MAERSWSLGSRPWGPDPVNTQKTPRRQDGLGSAPAHQATATGAPKQAARVAGRVAWQPEGGPLARGCVLLIGSPETPEHTMGWGRHAEVKAAPTRGMCRPQGPHDPSQLRGTTFPPPSAIRHPRHVTAHPEGEAKPALHLSRLGFEEQLEFSAIKQERGVTTGWGAGGDKGGNQPIVRHALTVYDRDTPPWNLTMALLPEKLGVLLLILKSAG